MLISILTGISILTAVSILTVVYPKVVLTVVFILSGSSLSDSSLQHSPHFNFHVIFISAYSAVRVIIYAYVKYTWLFAGKVSNHCKPATAVREETTTGMQMITLVKDSTR